MFCIVLQVREVLGHALALARVGHVTESCPQIVDHVMRLARRGDDAGDGRVADDELQE